MRADMAKVLVERPRRGGQYHRKGRCTPLELLPTKEGMRRRWTDHKELNENLAPLRRFLASRVGYHWDSVYAELSAHLTPRNAVQQHVRSHLTNFVALHLLVTGDGALADSSWRGVGWRHGYDFYVDPRDGILKRSLSDKTQRREAQRQRQRAALRRAHAEVIVLGSMRELHRIHGIWYQVDFLPFPSRQNAVPAARACRTGRVVPQNGGYDILQHTWVMTGERYAANKRQLTTHELRQHNLSNRLS
jgi:hypothetical protein